MAEKRSDRPSWLRYSGIGIEFAAAVAGFSLVGYWIDRGFDTGPWGLVICAALGLIGGTYNMVRASLRAFADEERSRKKNSDE